MLKFAVGGVLLVTAAQAIALSLGGTSGSVIIGRPLNILVQSSIDAAEAASGLCLNAEVHYGDTAVAASSVAVSIDKVGTEGAVRVRSSQPVNEPIVTVVLKVGCEQNYTRSYALLSDFEPLVTAPVTVTPQSAGQKSVALRQAAAPASSPLPAPAKKPPPVFRVEAPRPRPPHVLPPVSKRKPAPIKVAEVPESVSAPAPKTALTIKPETTGPRLELTPIDLSPVAATGTVLQSSSSAPAPVSDADPVGQMVSSTPAEVPPQQDQRLVAMERELERLRADQERMRLSMEAVNAQLTQARGERYSNPLVYGLGGVLALVLAALGFLLQRLVRYRKWTPNQAAPWWVLPPDSTGDVPAAPSSVSVVPEVAGPTVGLSSVAERVEGVDSTASVTSTPLPAESPSSASVADLLDLMRKVDFFDSLGQGGRDEVEALRTFVDQYPRSSEVPYLLLLRRCAEQSNGDQLQEIAALYERDYHRPAPAQSAYAKAAPGLEDDAAFLRRLCAVWPLRESERLLEEALLSSPNETQPLLHVRTLEAFLDLLMLHSLWHSLGQADQSVVATIAAAVQPASTGLEVDNREPEPGWVSVSEFVDPAEPVVEEHPLLDMDLAATGTPSDSVAADTSASLPEDAGQGKELPALEFDFFDFGTPPQEPSDSDAEDKPVKD